MPRIKLTKSAIDALPTPSSDVVYWDAAYPGFGVKITPKGPQGVHRSVPRGRCRIELPHRGNSRAHPDALKLAGLRFTRSVGLAQTSHAAARA